MGCRVGGDAVLRGGVSGEFPRLLFFSLPGGVLGNCFKREQTSGSER